MPDSSDYTRLYYEIRNLHEDLNSRFTALRLDLNKTLASNNQLAFTTSNLLQQILSELQLLSNLLQAGDQQLQTQLQANNQQITKLLSDIRFFASSSIRSFQIRFNEQQKNYPTQWHIQFGQQHKNVVSSTKYIINFGTQAKNR